MEEKKVPALRFRGFDNAWEQRRLGELADKVTEKNTLLAKTEVLTNSAEFGIINQREFFDHDIVNENNIGGYYIVRERDFVYNPRISVSAPVGPINCNKLGKSGVMSPLYTVFRVHDIDSVYLEYFFKTSRWHSFMRFNGDSGVRSDRFSIKTELFYKMPIPITKYCEQVKIGKYFSQLDHLISLHQRKLEMLKKVKKSMLEKMFPKNDAKVPEVRFSDFTDAWEQHKLGEVATYRRGSFPQPYGKSEWYDGNGAMPFVQVADVSDEMNLVEDTKQKISILAQPMSVFVEQNSVLVTLQGSIGRVAIMQYDAFVDRTVLIFEKYKAEIDKTFWAYIIKQKFIDEARKAPGGTIKTITKEALSDFDLSIPKYQEQKQIGEYFRNLDHLISLHQRKLEKLKNIKKSMLEKMFII